MSEERLITLDNLQTYTEQMLGLIEGEKETPHLHVTDLSELIGKQYSNTHYVVDCVRATPSGNVATSYLLSVGSKSSRLTGMTSQSLVLSDETGYATVVNGAWEWKVYLIEDGNNTVNLDDYAEQLRAIIGTTADNQSGESE